LLNDFNEIDLGVANTIFASKVLLEHSPAHSFVCGLQLFLSTGTELSS
jgi:hypothetical protein